MVTDNSVNVEFVLLPNGILRAFGLLDDKVTSERDFPTPATQMSQIETLDGSLEYDMGGWTLQTGVTDDDDNVYISTYIPNQAWTHEYIEWTGTEWLV